MSSRVVLHIGLMKSGTKFVQTHLGTHRDAMRERGVLFPGETWRDQMLAATDVTDRDQQALAPSTGAWARLAEEMAAYDGTSVVSMEFFAPIGEDKVAQVARRVAEDVPGAVLDVVVTARDLNRTIPAMWQETLKNSRTWSWTDYLDGVRRGPGAGSEPGDQFWREQDLAEILRRWCAVVGHERVTLVTLPPPGARPDALWDRFCQVLGTGADVRPDAAAANESLGAASAELLRQVNEVLAAHGLERPAYLRHVKHELAKRVMASHRGEEQGIGLPLRRWVRRRAALMRQDVAALEREGLRLVGDLADLSPVAVPGADPRKVDPGEQLDAAVAALAAQAIRRAEQDDA